jgi:hypothetical protein
LRRSIAPGPKARRAAKLDRRDVHQEIVAGANRDAWAITVTTKNVSVTLVTFARVLCCVSIDVHQQHVGGANREVPRKPPAQVEGGVHGKFGFGDAGDARLRSDTRVDRGGPTQKVLLCADVNARPPAYNAASR